MICARYIVFDDAPQERRLDCTADQFADALRFPLARVGVRVVRQHGTGSALPSAGFQVRGWSRSQYNAKLKTVAHIVDGVVKSLTEPQRATSKPVDVGDNRAISKEPCGQQRRASNSMGIPSLSLWESWRSRR
jgi:hypothetical protein